jgi:hypothetical protein
MILKSVFQFYVVTLNNSQCLVTCCDWHGVPNLSGAEVVGHLEEHLVSVFFQSVQEKIIPKIRMED